MSGKRDTALVTERREALIKINQLVDRGMPVSAYYIMRRGKHRFSQRTMRQWRGSTNRYRRTFAWMFLGR